jgi:hypothetical protein
MRKCRGHSFANVSSRYRVIGVGSTVLAPLRHRLDQFTTPNCPDHDCSILGSTDVLRVFIAEIDLRDERFA